MKLYLLIICLLLIAVITGLPQYYIAYYDRGDAYCWAIAAMVINRLWVMVPKTIFANHPKDLTRIRVTLIILYISVAINVVRQYLPHIHDLQLMDYVLFSILMAWFLCEYFFPFRFILLNTLKKIIIFNKKVI